MPRRSARAGPSFSPGQRSRSRIRSECLAQTHPALWVRVETCSIMEETVTNRSVLKRLAKAAVALFSW